MKSLKIMAINEVGEMAIRKHVEETYKLKNTAHRLAFKKLGYTQKIISETPCVLLIEITNPTYQMLMKPKHFCDEVAEAMEVNGAKREIDYMLEVE